MVIFNTIAFRQRCCPNLILSIIPQPAVERALIKNSPNDIFAPPPQKKFKNNYYLFRWNNQKGGENICRQLGYRGGTKYTAPGGTGPIHAGNRLCKGGEKTVWDCPLQQGRSDTTGCSHDIDQGVHCNDIPG